LPIEKHPSQLSIVEQSVKKDRNTRGLARDAVEAKEGKGKRTVNGTEVGEMMDKLCQRKRLTNKSLKKEK